MGQASPDTVSPMLHWLVLLAHAGYPQDSPDGDLCEHGGWAGSVWKIFKKVSYIQILLDCWVPHMLLTSPMHVCGTQRPYVKDLLKSEERRVSRVKPPGNDRGEQLPEDSRKASCTMGQLWSE